jgi:hypothetical protein
MATVQDLTTFRQAVETFYRTFTAEDWARKHGKHWTFADPLYHLTTIQQPILASFRGEDTLDDISKMRDMDAWNDQQFAQRPATMTPQQMLADFLAVWKDMENTVYTLPAETVVYMPLMRLRGERRIDLLLEYALWHAWFHITETSIRRDGKLLALPSAMQSRLFEFFLIVIGGMIDKQEAKGTPFNWVINITGEGAGVWTMHFENGIATIERGSVANADVTMTTDIVTFLKAMVYQISSPVAAMLFRRIRVKGWGKLRRLLRLIRPRRSREWAALPESYTLLPTM